MKRLLGGIGFIVLLLVVGFGAYGMKLHALSMEGNRIFEKRCISVNPHLIGYKKIFLMFADQANNPEWASGEQMSALMFSYIDHMRLYTDAESKWLEEDKRLINRWDFKLLEPWYIKKAGELQWKMYEGYRDDAKYLLNIWDHPEKLTSVPDPDFVSEPRQRRDKYNQEYFEFFKEASNIRDWRKFFGTVPIPKGCTEENIMIPNTSGAIDWDRDPNDSTPSGIPIDPYGVS